MKTARLLFLLLFLPAVTAVSQEAPIVIRAGTLLDGRGQQPTNLTADQH